jgi:NAD(P)H-dependent flavin oxidoreductase YrpB (nitropropane dioxygenase family)
VTTFVATRPRSAHSCVPDLLVHPRLGEGNGWRGVGVAAALFSGLWARALRNTFSEEYEASGAPVLPPLVQRATAHDIYAAAAKQQSREYFPMWSGQSVGLIRDLPGAGEVVHAIIREARTVLADLHGRVRLD